MNDKNKKPLIILAVVLVLVVAIATILVLQQQQAMKGLEEQFTLQKEELEEEYTQFAVQYEGYGFKINNDSLFTLYETEKFKVQRLLEELKTVKATNASRINELKKELETVRKVMRTYIAQIDSLNQVNQQLTEENKEVKQRFTEASRTVNKLTKEKEALNEKVTLASQLNAVNINVGILNKNGRKARKVKDATKLQFDFLIAKNITAQTGEKYIYIRILKPDNDALIKSRSDLFRYENKDISYSARRMIEYDGEETPVTIYWDIEEFLYPGEYRLDIFADGNLIGNRRFRLEN